jgi:hypothetical protein
MIDRTQRILGTVLGIQLVVLILLWSPWSQEAPASTANEVFPELEVSAIERIEIEADDRRVRLSRFDEGWRIDDLDGFPAEPDRVSGLIDDVTSLRVGMPVVRSGRYHETLGVSEGESEARVRFLGPDDEEPLVDVMLGTSPNFGRRHVRVAGDDRVYEVRGLDRSRVRAEADWWVEKAVFPEADARAVTRVRIAAGSGELVLARGDEGTWKVDVDTTGTFDGDSEAAERLVRDLAGLRLLEPAGADAPRFSEQDAAATLELQITDAEETLRTIVLLVGPEMGEDDGRRVARRTDHQRNVILGSYDAGRILDPGN